MANPGFRKEARLAVKGHKFEDFCVGQEFSHHWGRTITETDSAWFSTQTLAFNPLYFNEPWARA